MSLLAQFPVFSILHKLALARKQRLWLVGGALRDARLARAGRDLDFAVKGDAIALARAFAKTIKGAFVLLDQESGCARVAKKRADGLWTYDFADLRAGTLKGDLSRRDFTINTLATELKDVLSGHQDKIQAHPRALSDLKSKTIRMVGERSFRDDPLRLLRAYSLQAQLGFKIEPKTLACIKSQRALIRRVSPERVREELFKVLSSARAARVIKGMDRDGMLVEIMPQIRVMYGVIRWRLWSSLKNCLKNSRRMRPCRRTFTRNWGEATAVWPCSSWRVFCTISASRIRKRKSRADARPFTRMNMPAGALRVSLPNS